MKHGPVHVSRLARVDHKTHEHSGHVKTKQWNGAVVQAPWHGQHAGTGYALVPQSDPRSGRYENVGGTTVISKGSTSPPVSEVATAEAHDEDIRSRGHEEVTSAPRFRREMSNTSLESDDGDADSFRDPLLPTGLNYFEISSNDLIDSMGVSGLCVLDFSGTGGLTGLPLSITLPMIELQSFLLQGTILYYMANVVRDNMHDEDIVREVPQAVLFVAIYLHFLNCISNVPLAVAVAGQMHVRHEGRVLFLIEAYLLWCLDAVVVPMLTLVIGALYLCTSTSVADVVLSACAVAFVGNVDNYILNMNAMLNKMAARKCEVIIQLPCSTAWLKWADYLLIIVPVVPATFTGIILQFASHTMHLA